MRIPSPSISQTIIHGQPAKKYPITTKDNTNMQYIYFNKVVITMRKDFEGIRYETEISNARLSYLNTLNMFP